MSARQKYSRGTCCLCSGRLHGSHHIHRENLSSDLKSLCLVSCLEEMDSQSICKAVQ